MKIQDLLESKSVVIKDFKDPSKGGTTEVKFKNKTWLYNGRTGKVTATKKKSFGFSRWDEKTDSDQDIWVSIDGEVYEN